MCAWVVRNTPALYSLVTEEALRLSRSAAGESSFGFVVFSGSFQGCTSPEPKHMKMMAGMMYTTAPTRNTLFHWLRVFFWEKHKVSR